LALSPDPKYRLMAWNNTEDPMLVYPDGLPTLKDAIQYNLRREPPRSKFSWHSPYPREISAADLRLAVVLAIDKGIHWKEKGAITREGVILK
jgi:hypothetical protein